FPPTAVLLQFTGPGPDPLGGVGRQLLDLGVVARGPPSLSGEEEVKNSSVVDISAPAFSRVRRNVGERDGSRRLRHQILELLLRHSCRGVYRMSGTDQRVASAQS